MTNASPAPVSPAPLSPSDERTWAMLAHLSVLTNPVTLFLGPILALIIYLVYKERSRSVGYHAMQAFIFQLIGWAGGMALAGLARITVDVLSIFLNEMAFVPASFVISLIPVAAVIYGIIGSVQTWQGRDFKYWLIGDWVRGTLAN